MLERGNVYSCDGPNMDVFEIPEFMILMSVLLTQVSVKDETPSPCQQNVLASLEEV